jgi:DNA-binding NtrC family response regulator
LLMEKVLIADDDGAARSGFVSILRENGFSLIEAPHSRDALEAYEREMPAAALVDLNIPAEGGVAVMRRIKRINPIVPVIMLTEFDDISLAVEAVKLGAYDFIVKPPKVDKLVFTLRRAIEEMDLKRALERLNTAMETSLEWTLGKGQAIKRIIRQMHQVAASDFSIIIQGETGTGKSFIASAIHGLSKRAERPFVTVDMGSIPESLVESELFGHERGAFTGAERKKKGYFEAANEGTILIDELQNMSPYVQSKLLTVVEDKKIYPLGSTRPMEIDVRIIAATNSDIKQSVREKKFREDLFFRLGDFIITLPPLRERVEDIPFLAQKFLRDAASELNKHTMEISPEAVSLLVKNPWSGNVRELKNVMRRAVLLSDGDVIGPEHINFLIEDVSEDKVALLPLKEVASKAIRSAEKQAIKQALCLTAGKKSKAASVLQVDYKTLLTKIKHYGIN